MLTSKHIIQLSKNHVLDGSHGNGTNVFLFNENGKKVQAKWLKKTIEQNNGSFIILDHNERILDEVQSGLKRRGYFIEKVNFNEEVSIKINPFDLVSNTSEIHFMFLNFIYALWDNSDPDITLMSNLMDAFASCIYAMFANQKEKLNMYSLRKMVYSVRATCDTEDGSVMMSDAIFANMKDQESMPCKYYAQFSRTAGDRKVEVAEKLAQVFDKFTDFDLETMNETDSTLMDSLNFKTAVFVNVEKAEQESSARILSILLNNLIRNSNRSKQTLFVIDNMNADHCLISLPLWIKESLAYNMSYIIMCDDLASFKNQPDSERFFKNLRKTINASILMHHNDDLLKFENELPSSMDELTAYVSQNCMGQIIIPHLEISVQDQIF